MTNGGARHVLECVGTAESMRTAIGAARPGGTVGYVGVPHGDGLTLLPLFGANIALRGGIAPVRAWPLCPEAAPGKPLLPLRGRPHNFAPGADEGL